MTVATTVILYLGTQFPKPHVPKCITPHFQPFFFFPKRFKTAWNFVDFCSGVLQSRNQSLLRKFYGLDKLILTYKLKFNNFMIINVLFYKNDNKKR